MRHREGRIGGNASGRGPWRAVLVLLMVITLLGGPRAVQAADLLVTTGGDGAGTCPGPSCTLRAAIAAASAGDTIGFASGVTTVTLETGELSITKSVTITGSSDSIVSIERDTATGAPKFRLIAISNAAIVTLQYLLLFGGEAERGGAIASEQSQLTLQDTIIVGNAAIATNDQPEGLAEALGGGIYATGGTLTLIDSTVWATVAIATNSGDKGKATAYGGGIATNGTAVTLQNSSILGNVTQANSQLSVDDTNFVESGGGGLNVYEGSLTVTDSQISRNITDARTSGEGRDAIVFGAGGGLRFAAGTEGILAVTGSTFEKNIVNLPEGSADATSATGAGISASGGSLTLTGNTISENEGTVTGPYPNAYGGGLQLVGPSVTLTNNTIRANILTTTTTTSIAGYGAISAGGGLWARGTTVSLTGNTISENELTATGTVAGGVGGGVWVQNTPAFTLTDNTISDNVVTVTGTASDNPISPGGPVAQGYGGGLSVYLYSQGTLDGNTISGNSMTATGARVANYGGGVYALQSALAVTNSTISGNELVANSTLGSNAGGGIAALGNPLTVTNSTISGNTATSTAAISSGGGIYGVAITIGSPPFLAIDHATLADNTANGAGQHVAIETPNTTATIARSVIGYTGTAPDAAYFAEIDGAIAISTGGNISQRDLPDDTEDDETLTNPLLGPLADNSGGTRTHLLLTNSPAINFIPTEDCTLATDQRGIARPQLGGCDSGAVELAPGNSSASPSASSSSSASPSPNPLVYLSLTTNGTGTVERNPAGEGDGPFGYPENTVVTLTPQPGTGQTFTGWTVDGVNRGWANPLTITMEADHTVQATFAPTKAFDVPTGHIAYGAIVALASRGTILGYNANDFGEDDGVQRAQMAALISRATPFGPGTPTNGYVTPPDCTIAGSWDCEDWGNTFTDRGGIDLKLWRDAGTLQHYDVARGYTAADCAAKGRAFPCYGPTDPVSYAQTIAFITRAMIVKGYWVAQPNAPLPYQGVPDVLATEVKTYVHYTGGVPQPPANWNAGANRGWFAMALWSALDSYWGTDDRLPDGRDAGGFVP